MEPPATSDLPIAASLDPTPQPEAYEACDQCSAPVEANQRYCVACGTRRKHVHDPAARFLSTATSRSRAGARSVPSASRSRGPGLGTALVLAAIPLAVILGVLLGHAGNGGGDAKLIAALRAQKPEVVNIGGGSATGSSVPVSATSLTSTFSLQRGYAVELEVLPAQSDQSTATSTEQSARAKGATAVGVISQSGFTVRPSPPSGDYVIYSGQYKQRADAQRALAKLKRDFPAAIVIAVAAKASTAASGAVLNTTAYGSFHSVVGIKPPSKSQLTQGAQITKRVASQIKSNYVQSQKGLPNEISVP